MARRPLRLGLAQMPVVMGDKKANVAAAEAAVNEAARAGCRLVVLPECPLAGCEVPGTPLLDYLIERQACQPTFG